MTKSQILLPGMIDIQVKSSNSHILACLRDSQRGAFLSQNTLKTSRKSVFANTKKVKEDGKKEIENLLYSFDLPPCGKVNI